MLIIMCESIQSVSFQSMIDTVVTGCHYNGRPDRFDKRSHQRPPESQVSQHCCARFGLRHFEHNSDFSWSWAILLATFALEKGQCCETRTFEASKERVPGSQWLNPLTKSASEVNVPWHIPLSVYWFLNNPCMMETHFSMLSGVGAHTSLDLFVQNLELG